MASPPGPGSTPGVERVISALNGVLGDYLHARGNGLAVRMSLVDRGAPLPCEPAALRRARPRATGLVCVLVHGLAENECAWEFPGRRGGNYGTRLARELGFTPYAVRYNTGLRLGANGRELAQLLEALTANHPVPVRRLVILGHSMGGLVARRACQEAAEAGHRWLGLTTDLVCIGSPHLGAPLEKLGQAVARGLRAVGNPYTRLVADVLELRSAGIKDLGLPGLAAAGRPAHRLVAGTLRGGERDPLTWLLGDGLVRVPSATRLHHAPADAAPGPVSTRVFPGIPHRALAHDARVYRQIAAWCAEARP